MGGNENIKSSNTGGNEARLLLPCQAECFDVQVEAWASLSARIEAESFGRKFRAFLVFILLLDFTAHLARDPRTDKTIHQVKSEESR